MICVKSNKEIEKMQKAGAITAGALIAAGEAIRPGMTTYELDKVVHRYITSHGAKPSFLGYGGFPGSACISVNDEIIHGIPGPRTEESLYLAIDMVKPGVRLGDLGAAIQKYNEDNGYSVVRQFVGHGVGKNLHEDPEVPNYGKAGHGIRLVAGMVIAIEPMINMGTADIKTMPDGWTVKTKDGKWAAHFEHTIAVTPDGAVILTKV